MFNTYLSNFFMGNPFLKEEEEEEEEEGAIIHEIDNQNHKIIPFRTTPNSHLPLVKCR
jgi:hypothetical protein